MRWRFIVGVGASVVVLLMPLGAFAANHEDAPPIWDLFERRLWAEYEPGPLTPEPLFAGADGELLPLPDGDLWGVQAYAVNSWDIGETLTGPSEAMPPGFHWVDGLAYAGVEPANDLPTDVLRALTIQTESMLTGCEGVRREVAVSVARPGLPVYESNDEFVGNPGIGNNLQIAFAINDCQPEGFYLELVDGQFQAFQSRVGLLYKDDGTVATVTFVGGLPTLDGAFSVSAAESPVPFTPEGTFGYNSGAQQWPTTTGFPTGERLADVVLDELIDRTFLLVDVPVAPTAEETTTTSSIAGPTTTTTIVAGSPSTPQTDEQPDETQGGDIPVVPIAIGGTVLGVGGYVGYRRLTGGETDTPTTGEPPVPEPDPDPEEPIDDDPDHIWRLYSGAAETALAGGAETTDDGWVYIDQKTWVQATSYEPWSGPYTPADGGDVFVNIRTGEVLEPETIDTSEQRDLWIGLCWQLGIDPRPGLAVIGQEPEADQPAEEAPAEEEREGAPVTETPVDEHQTIEPPQDDISVDTSARPVTVNLITPGLTGNELERMERIQTILNTYRGSGDIAGAAESLWAFNRWHNETFGEDWFTWTNDQGDDSLIRAVTVEDFLLCREMCCYEFVHLSAYIASDQLGRPRFSMDGEVDGMIPAWGLLPRLFDAGTGVIGDAAPPRGTPITAVHRYFDGNTAGYFHVSISLGDGNVIGLGAGGLEHETISGCFNPIWYKDLQYSYYQYGASNPAPTGSD